MGTMVMVNISLDVISMITLIMCTGFSVDFCAHICHNYFHSEKNSVKEKVQESLAAYGKPICEGAISTVAAVFPLVLTNSYILQTFAIMVFLVVGYGLFFGVIVIPTFLMISDKFKK